MYYLRALFLLNSLKCDTLNSDGFRLILKVVLHFKYI